MADGNVVIDVGLNTGNVDKELAKLKGKIQKAEQELEGHVEGRDAISERLKKATEQAEQTRGAIADISEAIREMESAYRGEEGSIDFGFEEFTKLPESIAEAKKDLAEHEKLLKAQEKEISSITKEHEKAVNKIEEERQKLEELKSTAGNLARTVQMENPGIALAESFGQAQKKMLTFLKYALGIRSLYVLVRRLKSAVVDAVRAFASEDAETQATITNLRAALAGLKASWGAAFAPILTAVAPLLHKLIDWLTTAANAIARFIAIISGKSTYKKAVANVGELSSGIGGVGSALDDTAESAKEAEKQLAGFDELNILKDLNSDDKNKSKGGGGGGGNGIGSNGFSLQEEAVDAFDGSFLSRLALAVKDVIFDWGNWTPEKILEKAIAFLPAAAGAYLGWNIGGFKGAVIGGIAGLILGLMIDANTFNFDGKISKDEVIKLAIQAIPAIAGLLVGFASGNPLLGIAVGLALSFFLNRALSTGDGSLTSDYIKKAAIELIPALAGLLIGFISGNPLLGIGVYIALRFAISSINPTEEGVTKETWFERLRNSLHFPTGKEIKDWCKKFFWEDGVKAFFKELYSLFTGEQLTRETVDGWLKAFRTAINFPEGMDVWEWCKQFFWEDGVKAFFLELKNLIFGWNGAHDAGEALADSTAEGMGTIDGKLSTWWNEHVKPWFTVEKWRELGRTAIEGIKNGLKSIQMPRFHFSWGSAAYNYNFFGKKGTVNIPYPNIDWYAKGGVFDAASIIGVGEAGKEAVVPLERNTEWITLVADGIGERLTHGRFVDQLADAFMSTRMPAMAGGSVVPPNAAFAGSQGGWNNSVMEELKALREEISALANQPIEVDSRLYLDRREVGQAVTEYQRSEARVKG